MQSAIGLRFQPGRKQRPVCFAMALLLTLGVAGAGRAKAQSTRPCDTLGLSSSTACVSAYSTIRSLSSSYTGNLYQVTRALDNTTQNIGTLSDGFANAAIQDAFCALTTCTIIEIYDQSGNGNNLTVAPPGGEDAGTGPNQYDLPASATLLPVIAGGHKVYGIYVPPGVGYRDDGAKKTAVGNEAQGVYMVTTGLNLTNRCCFDFGNAETDNHDDGPSTMDALNITNPGSGGAVGFDLEQGVFGQTTTNSNNLFVTAAGSNDGVSTFQVYSGNAQSGSLATSGSQSLASLTPQVGGNNQGSYAPMRQQGAVILGIGGDNSNTATGEFFEGVMTAGDPSSSLWGQVQTNIVSATYNNAPTLVDGQTYTFQNQASGMSLDNDCDGCSGSPTTGQEVIQYTTNGVPAQQWTIHSQGNGFFTMVNVQSGLCLDDPYGNGTPSRTLPQTSGTSTMLWQVGCNGNPAQNWKFVLQANSSYVIQNQASTLDNGGTPMVIDVQNGQASAGLQMWLYYANGQSPQNWFAALASGSSSAPSGSIADGGTYTITNQTSGMSLDNDCDGCSGSPTTGQEVIQYNVNGVPAQQWTIHSQGDGYFTIVSVQSGLCLDDPYGNGTPSRNLPQTNGSSTMLWQVGCNGNPAQNWRFNLQSNGNYVIQNQAATTDNPNGSAMVIDVYNGQSTAGLEMWLYTANGNAAQNWQFDLQ